MLIDYAKSNKGILKLFPVFFQDVMVPFDISWNLQVMIMLVKNGMLSKREAIKTSGDIHADNHMITEEVLNITNFISHL